MILSDDMAWYYTPQSEDKKVQGGPSGIYEWPLFPLAVANCLYQCVFRELWRGPPECGPHGLEAAFWWAALAST
jgi:hypothetical protein